MCVFSPTKSTYRLSVCIENMGLRWIYDASCFILIFILLLQQIHTMFGCHSARVLVFIYVFHYFLFSFFLSPSLFRSLFQVPPCHFEYDYVCCVCTNVLSNYVCMMESRRQPNFLIAIVLECLMTILNDCAWIVPYSRKILHSIRVANSKQSSWLWAHTHFSKCLLFLFVVIYALVLLLSMEGASISFKNRINDYQLAIAYLFVIFRC